MAVARHEAAGNVRDTNEAEGGRRARAIGVANFTTALLKTVVEDIKAPIACNQVEYHVMLDQAKLMKYMAAQIIPLVAYCPLAQGRVASDEVLTGIGNKHGASAAQVALKWLLDQDGVAAIPKASRAESQKANLDALKVMLDDDDRKAIAATAEEPPLRQSRALGRIGISAASRRISRLSGRQRRLLRSRSTMTERQRKWPLAEPFPYRAGRQ